MISWSKISASQDWLDSYKKEREKPTILMNSLYFWSSSVTVA